MSYQLPHISHKSPSQLDICENYTRGLSKKTTRFINNEYQQNFKVITLNETWLNPPVLDSELFPEMCNIHSVDRNYSSTNTTLGGGVHFAVLNDFISHQID